MRRVGTIALVHETLSQGFDETVNFDEIAVRGLRAVVEVADPRAAGRVDVHRDRSGGCAPRTPRRSR